MHSTPDVAHRLRRISCDTKIPYTFQTEWEYDSWNRLKSIQYPDGEILFPMHPTTTTHTILLQGGSIKTLVHHGGGYSTQNELFQSTEENILLTKYLYKVYFVITQ